MFSYKDYLTFNGYNPLDPSSFYKTLRLQDLVNDTNSDKVVLVKGFSYDISKQKIADVFRPVIKNIDEDDVEFELIRGKLTGSACVNVGSWANVQKCRKKLYRKTIDDRILSICDKNTEFMQRVCNLTPDSSAYSRSRSYNRNDEDDEPAKVMTF